VSTLAALPCPALPLPYLALFVTTNRQTPPLLLLYIGFLTLVNFIINLNVRNYTLNWLQIPNFNKIRKTLN
jgi:hypothetical protein